jgi:putative DNA primase/helicase
LNAALGYARRGWRVIPLHWINPSGKCTCRDAECTRPGKHPLWGGWKNKATTDEATIERWWTEVPHANIGILTGRTSGLLVLDVDKGGADTIEKAGGFPETLWCQTGNGAHHYFAHPGEDIPNAVKFASGLDIRSDGGLVVAPPSRHVSGHRYTWLSDPERPLEPAPEWLLAAIRQHISTPPPAASSDSPVPSSGPSHGGGDAYAEAALRRELDRLGSAPDGQRNDALNRAAFSLGTLIQANKLDRSRVEAELEHAARVAGLEEGEIRRTIRSGIDAGIRKATASPRQIDPPRAPSAPTPAGQRPQLADLNRYNRSDVGNAECLALMHANKLRYCHTRRRWLRWNSAHWELDETGEAQRTMIDIARSRYRAAEHIDSLEERKAAARWAIASESSGKIEAALRVAAWSSPPFASNIDLYDSDAWLAATHSNTLNLRTATTRPARPDDYITMALGAAFDQAARCPRWERFMQEITGGNDELASYMQRAVGYSLTGDTTEQVLFLCHGGGANGKSVFLDVITWLLGDYAANVSFDTFDASRRSEATNDLAALKGKRFVSVVETKEDQRLDEARVKSVTGQDLITCRFLYGEFFSYRPMFKVWMAMNHLPRIIGTDRGIWRRIRVIPFTQNFEGQQDKRLRETLLGELPGILNWALAGLRAWLADGLGTCPQVDTATRHYQHDSDQVGRWIDECCVIEPEATMNTKEGYKNYADWCDENNERTLSQNLWARRMREKGHERKKEGYSRLYLGIGLQLDISHGAHGGIFRDSPCENKNPKSSDSSAMCAMNEEESPPPPPVGRKEEAVIDRSAQQIVEEAVAKAARILSNPTGNPNAARWCAYDVPDEHKDATLARIDKLIAEFARKEWV